MPLIEECLLGRYHRTSPKEFISRITAWIGPECQKAIMHVLFIDYLIICLLLELGLESATKGIYAVHP